MKAIWFSLGINTLFFLADVFIKISSAKLSTGKILYTRSIYTVFFATLWLLFSGAAFNFPGLKPTLQLLGSSVLCLGGLYFYIVALRHLHFVNVSVIGILGALIHYAIDNLVNHQQFHPYFFVAAALGIFGIGIQWKSVKVKKGILEACMSALLWGFGYAFISFPLASVNAAWGSFIMEATALTGASLFMIIKEPSYPLLRPQIQNWKIILVALFTIMGSVWLNIAYQELDLSAMGFMQLSFFPYSILAGYLIFKEKLNTKEWIGNLLVIAGLIIYFLAVH